MFAYVILHYRTLELTKQCVQKLLALNPDSPIAIVDNGSGDGSGNLLKSFFENYGNIHVVLSDTNLGFAKGNNLGYKFIKEKYNPDFIAVINNDVIISQPDFEQQIQIYSSDNGIDICGPDIVTPEGKHQNPLLREPFGTARLIKQIFIDITRLICLKLNVFSKRILSVYSKNSESFHKQEPDLSGIENCILQGSCVVFSRSWIDNEDFAFVPITFLYGEEMILLEYCKKKKYKTGICAASRLLHLGGMSTKRDLGEREKQIFKTRMSITANWKLVRFRLFG